MAMQRRLFDLVGCGKVTLEYIGSIKRFCERRADPGAEWTDHCSSVMRESMPVFIILTSKALGVILTRLDGTLLWPLFLMREHMGCQIFENTPAIRKRTSTTVLRRLWGRYGPR